MVEIQIYVYVHVSLNFVATIHVIKQKLKLQDWREYMESVCFREMFCFWIFQRYGKYSSCTFKYSRLNVKIRLKCINLKGRIFSHDHFSFIQVNYGSKTHTSAAHLHMLQESHMIVRNAFIGRHAKDEHLLDLYKESCGLLGEYYSQ